MNIYFCRKVFATYLRNKGIKPEIIDANFNELDKRLSDLEATMKMRVLGQISNLTSKIEKLNINE